MSLYLVTGGAGFIGSHITTALVQRGDRVRVLDDLSGGDLHNLAEVEVGPLGSGAPVEFLQGDVQDADDCRRCAEGAAGIFHEAAQVSVPDSIERPRHSYGVNVIGTLNVLEAARDAAVPRVVFAASSAAYGNEPTLPKHEGLAVAPCSPYASGKIAGEHLLRTWSECFGLRTVCLRYFNVFGPRQSDDSPYSGVIAIFARRLLEGLPITIFGDGGQTRDFVYVANVVAANLAAMASEVDEPGAVINVGSGEAISLNDLYRAMAAEVGTDAQPSFLPARAGDVRHSVADVLRAQELLGFRAEVTWQEGLRHTLAWYREVLAAATE
ncbi:MAG: NAD-dependent epimerase/dehydratase family protein [Planctomycetota bacterium]|nr:NAD-dependent epimerase/dehydratase family protein [Planctomycetota bacterium]